MTSIDSRSFTFLSDNYIWIPLNRDKSKHTIPDIPNRAMSKTTMKAVVFKGTLDVKIEDRPIPKIVDPTDIIIKVKYSALCGR
jgi:hypothetical protein